MFIYKCWPTSYEINKVTPSYSTSHIPPSTYTYAYVLQQVEDGCSKWKKTLAYLLVLPGSRVRIVRCGGRYDPQLVKRSSEWVFVCYCFCPWLELLYLTAVQPTSRKDVNKKLSCRRETARCFVFVCSQLQQLQRGFLLPVTAASDLLVHKILLWLGYPMVKNFWRYLYSFWRNSRMWQTHKQTRRTDTAWQLGGAYASHRTAKTMCQYCTQKIDQSRLQW